MFSRRLPHALHVPAPPTRTPAARLAGFAIAVVFALFAVRSLATPAAAQTAVPNACTALTPAEISATLGVTALAGSPMLPTRPDTCVWPIKPDPAHPGVTIRLEFFVPLGPQTPTQRFEAGKTPMNDIPMTPAAGVGDDAYYTTSTSTRLSVRKGETVFQLQVSGFPKADLESKEKTLALAILARL